MPRVEKVQGLIECVKSGLQSFMLEISHWTMLHGQFGRPVEVDSDQIETLIDNNQCSTTQKVADIFQYPNQ